MRFDLRCPVNIYRDGREVNVYDLIATQFPKERDVELVIKNDLNEQRTFFFHPIPDIHKTSQYGSDELYFGDYHLCHLEGYSEGEHSAITTCSLSLFGGLITINGRRYVLESRSDGMPMFTPMNSNDCSWNHRRKRSASDTRNAEYYAQYLDGRWRYVELALIADKLVYEKHGRNATDVLQRLHSLSNYVNSLYQPLNIRVILVWADVWSDGNLIDVSSSSDRTLSNFLNYRKELLKDHPHDNAHLLTGVVFDGNVVGKAYKGTMCAYDFSGGVDMEHSENGAFVAATIAHEMGHNFGLEHDYNEMECRCPARDCIMSPSTGITPPTFWSECSLRALQNSLARGVDYCLHNKPKSAYGGERCGNGIVEAGEECDCGTPTACINKCCDSATCRLAKDAKCATGECCDLETCTLKPATTKCRESTNTCDLPEYCDGQMEHCPADFFVQDGHRCPDFPEDYCYNGYCGSRDNQCQYIWGPTGRDAPPVCYNLNIHGSSSGNCGYRHQANDFLACARQDIKCGRLHCYHENEKLAFGDPSTVYTAYTAMRSSDGSEVACRVAWTRYVGGKKEPDPGMVPDGAACGENMMCVDGKCENRTAKVLMAPKCDPESCYGAGICNNMGNCHCLPGYGGTACAIPGPGGSVNSGPATEGSVVHVGLVVFWLLLAIIFAFLGASVIVKHKKDIWLHKHIWKKLRKVFKIERLLVPIRRAPPPPGPAPIRTEELNAVWGDSPAQVLRPYHQPHPPSFSPPLVPGSTGAPYSAQKIFSLRPKNAPPKVPFRPHSEGLHMLFDQKSDQITKMNGHSGSEYAFPPAENSASKLARAESFRPELPPPPPPHSQNPLREQRKPLTAPKPSVETKSGIVKNIAARFDPKLSQASTKFV